MSKQKRCQISQASHIMFSPMATDIEPLMYFQKELMHMTGETDPMRIKNSEVIRSALHYGYRVAMRQKGARE